MNYKEIEDYPNYIIYEDGKIYSKYKKIFRKPTLLKNQKQDRIDVRIGLSKDGKEKKFSLPRLLGFAFIYNNDPINKKYIDHIDRNPLNNDLSNLRWVTASENNINIKLRKDNLLGLRYISKTKSNSYCVLIQRLKYNKTYKTKEEAILQRNMFLESVGEDYLNIDV
jgi:hypothetical protein